MRRMVLALGFFLFWTLAATARAEELPTRLSQPEVRSALVGVVRRQLSALQANDWKLAYAQATREFQSLVPLRRFIALITENYPVVARNTRAEFGLPRDNGRVAIVPVRVFSANGSEPYNWILVKEGDGWRITGVVPQNTKGGA